MSREPRVSRISRASRERSLFEGFPALGAENHAARLLVLGSFPSVRSSDKGEYYGHERNHFWPLLFSFAERSIDGKSYADKRALAEDLGLAIWDMVRACRRTNSSDSELEIVELNDVGAFLAARPSIERIGLNGGLAAALFVRTIAEGGVVARGVETFGGSPRGSARALAATGGVAKLWIAGRERLVYRLPSTSPVPTRRFRTIDDKMALWMDFFKIDAGSSARSAKDRDERAAM